MTRRRHTIESLKAEASSKGWTLLSDVYKRGSDHYDFICEKGHKISKTADNFLRKSPCRVCSQKALLTIDDFKITAHKNNWKLLSKKYLGTPHSLKFRCLKCTIEFELISSAVRGKKRTKFCPNCSPTRQETLTEVKAKARGKGLKLISKEYTGTSKKHKWRCKNNHEWEAMPKDIFHKNSNCPHCRFFKNEAKIKYIFDIYFKCDFAKIKIKSSTIERAGYRNLELDGYNSDLKLAFEYNGIQHYKDVPFFHRTKDSFKNQKKRDKLTAQYCDEQNIDLVVIPYTIKEDEELVCHILSELPKRIKKDKLMMSTICSRYGEDFDILKPIRDKLKKGGFELLSNSYTSSTLCNLKTRCIKCGHEKLTSKNKIDAENGCLQCSGLLPFTMDELHEIAASKNGFLLSTNYTPGKTVKWKCHKGHTWDALPNSVKDYNKKGTWCPDCSHNKVGSIKKVKELVKQRGHTLLEGTYFNRESIFKQSQDRFLQLLHINCRQ